ncbi:MAG TPA: hypothetical protein VNN18_06210 [Candidatus Xenobia bacterium]|nr:hypothetical protein [Candidatus Xenobia bacterium]
MKTNGLFSITFALVFYCLGASFIEGFVNYRTWMLIGTNEFKTYHNALTQLIVPFMVIPLGVTFLLLLALLRWRPSAIPAWPVWLSVALMAVGIISSVAIQIPIQRELSSSGFSRELIERLILTDWIRKIPMIGVGVLMLRMMWSLLTNIPPSNAR